MHKIGPGFVRLKDCGIRIIRINRIMQYSMRRIEKNILIISMRLTDECIKNVLEEIDYGRSIVEADKSIH